MLFAPPLSFPSRIRRWWIPGGDLGTIVTLWVMRALVNGRLLDPLTRRAALAIRDSTASRDTGATVTALRDWLARRVRFQRDPRGVELLTDPRVMLNRLQWDSTVRGDCDDAAILGAAVGKALGLRARFRVLAFAPAGPFRHVVTDVWDGSSWRDLDVTAPGQVIPPTRRTLTVMV